MSTSVIPAVRPVAHSDTTGLVRTARGEYTAASVESDPQQAALLVKLKDGNYGIPIVAPADREASVNLDLTSLKHGG